MAGRLEMADNLARCGKKFRAEVGVDGEALIQWVGSDRGFEQGLDNSGFPDPRQADHAQCLVGGTQEIADLLDAWVDIEPGGLPSRQSD